MVGFDFLTGAFLMAVFGVFCVVISISLLADANASEPSHASCYRVSQRNTEW